MDAENLQNGVTKFVDGPNVQQKLNTRGNIKQPFSKSRSVVG